MPVTIKPLDKVRVPSSNMPSTVGTVVTVDAFWVTVRWPSGFAGTYPAWQVVKVAEESQQ